MARAEARPAPGQRDVDGAGRTARRRQFPLAHREGGLDVLLQLVGAAAEGLLLLGRGARDALHERRHPAALACHPPVAERLKRGVGPRAAELPVEERTRAIGAH